MLVLYLCFIIFVAAFTQGLVGFGFALVAAPLLTMLLGAKESVLLIICFTTLINLYFLMRYKHQVEVKKLGLLTLLTPLGVFLGTVLLPYLSNELLGLMIALVALMVVGLLLTGRRLQIMKTSKAIKLAGVLSGFLNVTVGLGGAPAVLLLEEQHVRKRRMIGDLAAYFLILNVFSVVGLVAAHEIPKPLPVVFGSTLPLAVMGVLVGQRYGQRLREGQFHFAVLTLMLIGATVALARSLSHLI